MDKKIKVQKIKKSKSFSLGSLFLILLMSVMFIAVFCLSGFYLFVIQQLKEQTINEKAYTNQTISTIILSSAKESLKNKNFEVLEEISRKLCDNNLVNYVVIYDNKNTKKIIWSTVSTVIDKEMSPDDFLAYYKSISPYLESIKIEPVSANLWGGHNVIIASNLESGIPYYIKSIFPKAIQITFILMLLFSLVALLMARILDKPIKKLTQGVQIFAKGNFDFKMPLTNLRELDILVNAFNEMAEMIAKTHSILEEKIKERTQQISQKNEELEKAYKDLQETQSMMVHGEKMRSLGELVSGITHEINNPINFIHGNLTHLTNYSRDLIEIIDRYKELEKFLPDEKKKEIDKILEEKEYDYLKEDLPDLIKSCQEGTIRTKNIVMDLKNFSRTDKMIINAVDINKEIDTTLNILYNKYKNKAQIHKEYTAVPPIDCYGGQLNQVLMNIIDNAVFAIGDSGDIFIRTYSKDNTLYVEIEDNGKGIAKENLEKIFEPFFTTKGVGEGTGLGMSISYKIIDSHGGKIEVESEVGKGTKFTVILPYDGLKKKGHIEE